MGEGNCAHQGRETDDRNEALGLKVVYKHLLIFLEFYAGCWVHGVLFPHM